MNCESSTVIHTLSCAERQLAGSCSTARELSLGLCDDPEGWDEGWAGGPRRRGYMYMDS